MNRDLAALVDDIMEEFQVWPEVFVESGTFRGNTTADMARLFERVYTVELSGELYEAAKHRFRRQPEINCIYGDSAAIIPQLCESIQEPAVWFLDAHWLRRSARHQHKIPDSNPFPIWDELRAVARRKYTEIVIVDDVQLFGSHSPHYPWWKDITIEQVTSCLNAERFCAREMALFMLRRAGA